MIWQRRLDSAADSQAVTSATLQPATTSSTTTTTTTTTAAAAAAEAASVVGKLVCAPASCPARYATAPPRRMMWPLREHRHIDAVYSYSPVSLVRSATLHLPAPAPVTSATLTSTTSDVTSHTVIL